MRNRAVNMRPIVTVGSRLQDDPMYGDVVPDVLIGVERRS
jgi:hypothetical protein